MGAIRKYPVGISRPMPAIRFHHGHHQVLAAEHLQRNKQPGQQNI